jgi:hypothetical protein
MGIFEIKEQVNTNALKSPELNFDGVSVTIFI